MNALALIPINDIARMADAMAESGLFGMKTSAQAMALMLVAQSEGQHPATIAQDYDVIQGKATRKTHSVLARFQAAGGRVEWHELTESKADATFAHPSGGALRMVWTIDQAKKANLTGKDNWKNYPRAMLRARCIAEGVRAVYPAALGGLMVTEEAMDSPTPTVKEMGPADVVPPVALAVEAATWPDDAFSKQLPRWTKAVVEGLKSHDDILTMARTKGALSAAQEAQIRAIKKPEPEAADADFVADMTAAEQEAQP